MASASDIGASFDNYQGNAVAGGETAGVLKIDTSPIMQLAGYTVQYHKSVWEQANTDAANQIAEISKISTLNPNNAIGKDKDEAIAAYNELLKSGADYAKNAPKTNEEKIQRSLEWQTKLAGATHTITSANSRALGYYAQKNDIENSTVYNAKQKKILLDELDKKANSTDINTPISPTAPKFVLKEPTVGDTAYTKLDVLKNDATGNGLMTNNHTLFDPKANLSAGFVISQGLTDMQNRKPANDIEREQFDLENASSNDQIVWNDASKFLNTAINDPKYKDDKGVTDFNKIESDNPLVANIVGLATRWNEYAAKMKDDIANGVFTDVNGKTLRDAKDYFTIDPKSGISAPQMVFLERFAKANPDALDTKYTHTGDATAAGRLAVESKKADADIIYKRAMAGAAGTKAKAYVDNIKQQMKLRNTKQEQDQMLEGLFTRNLTEQPTLVRGMGNGQVQLKIDAATSLPMFTFSGNKPAQLIPIDAKPVMNEAGTKVLHYEGGHFLTQYIMNGKPLNYAGMSSLYNNFKKIQGDKWQGSLDDFLKQAVKENQFDARIIGANGSTDKQLSIAAQRAISNQATGKGETPVFSTTDNPPTDDAAQPDTSSPDNLDQ